MAEQDIPIEELSLSSRAFYSLKRAEINTVDEILRVPKDELVRLRNFGLKSYDEVFRRLEEMNLLPPNA